MKKGFILTVSLLFVFIGISAQSILSYVDSTNVNGAGIWGGISWNGANINITTMTGNQIHLLYYDISLNYLGTDVQLTFPSDYQGTNIADHKHLYLNGYIYLSFMTSGNKELFLLKTDSLGNRVKIVTLENQSNNTYLTNDMHLVTDSSSIYVIYPKMSNIGFEKRVRKYNLNLDSVDTYNAISPIRVAPLGATFFKDSMFYMFSGNEDQHHLLVSRWNMDYTPKVNFHDTLITSVNNEWNYFSTGVSYDTINGVWYIAYHRMLPNDPPDHETIRIAVFDNNFNLLEDQQVTSPQHFRPHLLLHEGYLYMVYDGLGAVTIKKYKVNTNSSAEELNLQPHYNGVKIHPNPFSASTTIQITNSELQNKNYYLKISDAFGKIVFQKTLNSKQETLTLDLLNGIYFLQVSGDHFIQTKKLEVIK